MDERLEKFRDKIKLDNLTIAVACFILAFFSFLAAMGEAGIIPFFTPTGGDHHWQSMWRGMISGASFGVLALMLVGLIRGTQALKDDKKLKKLYIKTNDERQIQIWTAARASSMQVTLLIGLVTGMIIGYFNMIIGITILAVETFHAVVGACFKLYYNRKY